MSKKGVKWDNGKVQWGLLPFVAIREVARVMTWACTRSEPKPYPPNSWQGVETWRYIDALYRHLDTYLDPNRRSIDEESGLHTMAHAACCCLFIVHQELTLQAQKYR